MGRGCIFKHSKPREDEGRERIAHTWAYSDKNYLKSIFGSVSYCVIILRMTPHWSVRMTSCNFIVDIGTTDKSSLRSMGAKSFS